MVCGAFFLAGFLALFFAAFPLFCAANAGVEPITAVAGSSIAAPKPASMVAIIRCFIGNLHCEASWAINAQLAPLTNQSGEFLTKAGVFVDDGGTLQKLCPHGWHAHPRPGNAISPVHTLNEPGNVPHAPGRSRPQATICGFVQMLANGGTLDGPRIMRRTTLKLMTSDHLGGRLPLAATLSARCLKGQRRWPLGPALAGQ